MAPTQTSAEFTEFIMTIIAVLAEHGEERLLEICRVTLAAFQPKGGEA